MLESFLPSSAEKTVEYRCPGETCSISQAVHLGRLAHFYPACRECVHRDDTGTLSPRQVAQLAETRSRNQSSWFTAEGAAGVCPNDLGVDAVQAIAVAFGLRAMRQHNESADSPLVILGSDGRAITAELIATAAESLRCAGCHLVDVGPVTSASMAWAIDHWQAAGGILIGNADDRPQTVSLKFWSGGPHPLSAGQGLDELQSMCGVPAERPTRTFGSRRRFQADELYLATLAKHYHALRPLRWVLSTISLPLGTYVRQLTEAVACRAEITTLRWSDLIEQVRAQNAHFGLQISDDGEIARLVDEGGDEVSAERLLLLLARYCLANQPQGMIVLEPGTAPFVPRTIKTWGGRVIWAVTNPMQTATSRAVMEQTIRKSGALLGGGPSGRIWHHVGLATPDTLHTLTALLVILSRSDRPISEVLDAETPRD